MEHGAQGRAGRRSRRRPRACVNVGGEWYYEEYARGAGVSQRRPARTSRRRSAPSEDERNGILDLFKR